MWKDESILLDIDRKAGREVALSVWHGRPPRSFARGGPAPPKVITGCRNWMSGCARGETSSTRAPPPTL